MPEKSMLFRDLAPSPEAHFHICFYGCVLGLIEGAAAASGSFDRCLERFPFLAGYNNELAGRLAGLNSAQAIELWCAALEQWEDAFSGRLPLRSLRQIIGLTTGELLWLLTPGLIEEDARFGLVFQALQASAAPSRPVLGVMTRVLRVTRSSGVPEELLAKACAAGLLQIGDSEAPRLERTLRFSSAVWEALRTGHAELDPSRMRYRPPQDAPTLEELALPERLRTQLTALSRSDHAPAAIILRGPRRNGRRATLRALARARGQGVLEIFSPPAGAKPPFAEIATLAVLLNALPIIDLTASPDETVTLPETLPASVSLGVTMGPRSAFTGSSVLEAAILDLPLPALPERRQLWERLTPDADATAREALARGFRLTTGNLVRAARLARQAAALEGRVAPEPADFLEATRKLERHGLDLLAQRLTSVGGLGALCAAERTVSELQRLLRHCRHREALPVAMAGCPGGPPNCGVRALFTGSTGTGKTLAARLLAGELGKDVYRLDLSAVVNKYIGETEKNLHRLFDCAEELDVILLLDEGDALLTRRTDVHTANDRYANLETNFLLQRLESFQGILIITTNARERIDSAFERRMDVVVEFSAPTAEERLELWRQRLPANATVDHARLAELAAACELTGGQIQNAVTHATLLALDNGGIVTSEYIEAAVRREYRKHGGVCPLRPRFR